MDKTEYFFKNKLRIDHMLTNEVMRRPSMPQTSFRAFDICHYVLTKPINVFVVDVSHGSPPETRVYGTSTSSARGIAFISIVSHRLLAQSVHNRFENA